MSAPVHGGNAPQLPVRLGVIGSGRHVDELAAQQPWGYPFVGRHAVITACAPPAHAACRLDALAQPSGARRFDSGRELIAAGGVDAVLLLVPAAQRAELARAAIEAGHSVLCPAPLALGMQQMNALAQAVANGRSGAVIVAAGALAHTPAGRHALDVIAGGTAGRIESAYAGVRWHAHDAHARSVHAALPETAWDVLDFMLEALDAPVARVYAHAARLFESGDAHDTVVAIMRFANEAVFSFEAAACLPPALPAPHAGEIELELIGADETLRIEPYRTAVGIARTPSPIDAAHPGALARVEYRDWVEPPIAGMIGALLAAMREPRRALDALARQHRLAALADAMRASIESAQAVEAAAA